MASTVPPEWNAPPALAELHYESAADDDPAAVAIRALRPTADVRVSEPPYYLERNARALWVLDRRVDGRQSYALLCAPLPAEGPPDLWQGLAERVDYLIEHAQS